MLRDAHTIMHPIDVLPVRGACATQVYKARLDGLVDVAVKFIKPTPRRSGREQAERFNTEISILRACRDRNIVNFVGAFIYEVSLLTVSFQERLCRSCCVLMLPGSATKHAAGGCEGGSCGV